jgi:two-component system sensor histidine kinase YesM
MEIRYQEKFKAEIDMEDYLEEIKLPRMLLQPIVENSIVHGFAESEQEREGIIHIYSILENECIRIVLEDNGCGMEAGVLQRLRLEIDQVARDDALEVEGLSHVALINIQRRIWSYYGEGYGLEIQSDREEGTRITVILPVKNN